MIFLLLYWEFFKIGLFALGGGLATIPFLFSLSAATGWFTSGDIMNMLVISEITPGPLGINMATYAGYKTAGFFGGFVATAGIVTPPVAVIVAAAGALYRYKDNKYFARAFKGMFAAICALISVSVLKIFTSALIDGAGQPKLAAFVLFAIILVLIRRYRWHPFVYMLLAAGLGLIFHF